MKNKQEIWRDIPGYKDYYQVSDEGRVRSLSRTMLTKNGQERFYKGKIMEGSDVKGYKMLALSKGGKQEFFYIHQIVAVCFLGHKPDGHQLVIDHINGVKADNRAENLQIVSNRENTSTCHRKDRNTLSSDFVGVCYHKANKKFRAEIQLKNKIIYLGLFNNEEDASDTYQKALAKINDGTFNPEKYKPKWTSKHKGVHFNKASQKWIANPTINGKRIYLGVHTTEEDAYQTILEYEAIQPIVKNS